jgi:hypothetical protein
MTVARVGHDADAVSQIGRTLRYSLHPQLENAHPQ